MKRFTTTTYTNNINKRNFVQVIGQNYVAYREFLGQNRIKLNPGIRLKLPIVHQTRVVGLYEQMQEIRNMTCFTKDGVQVNIAGSLFFKINNPEKALYEIDSYRDAIDQVGISQLRAIIGESEYDSIVKDRTAINGKLYQNSLDSVKKWGIECTKFEISTFGPANSEIAKQLALQVDAERRRRENELITIADINTADGKKKSAIHEAEGKKQAKILESEGVLQSAKNTADGDFILRQKKADADKYEVEQGTAAMVDRLDRISAIIGSEQAVKYLLEGQRYDTYRRIGEGPNSKLYYFGDVDSVKPVVFDGDLKKIVSNQ